MRVWGRTLDLAGQIIDSSGNLVTDAQGAIVVDSGQGNLQWVEVKTDANGNNDLVYLTALCQVLLLNLGESPFYATYGIPAQQSVMQQTFPDYYVALTQQVYSQYFASLVIVKQSDPTPTYLVTVKTHQGVVLSATVPIPI